MKVSELCVASTANTLNITGKTLGHMGKSLELSSEEALLELIESGGSEVMVFDTSIVPEVSEAIINHPLAAVATDGAGFTTDRRELPSSQKNGLVHPRCFGTAPRFLHAIIAQHRLSLPEAIYKLTLLPATIMGLSGRGQLAVGAAADIVVFDPSEVQDLATLENPFQYSRGINTVIVNGKLAFQENQPTITKYGTWLRR
jgi:N-acyl-D-amino-acid deacylase